MFAGAFVLYSLGVWPREVTRTDEHRYIAVAREFVAGDHWLHCRLNGEEYAHKPPLFFWAVALLRGAGLPWEYAAKLPSALGAAISTALLFDLARRLYGRTAAWASAVVLVGTREYFALACRGNLDALLSAFTTLAAYAFVRATLCGADGPSRTRWTAAGFGAAGLGILVKGPAAVAIPGAAALVALVWDDRWARVPWWRWLAGILVLIVPPDEVGLSVPAHASSSVRAFAAAAGWTVRIGGFVALTGIWRSRWGALATWRWALAPLALLLPFAWAAAAAAEAPSGWGYVWDLAVGHGVAHAGGQVDKLESWWFYAKTFPLGLLPWTLAMPAAVWAWARWRAPDRAAADRFAMAWIVAPLVVMSLSKAKRDLYLIPVYPATALLAGRLAAALAADPARFGQRIVRGSRLAIGWTGVAAGALAVAAGLLRVAGADDWLAAWSTPWQAARGFVPACVPWALAGTGVLLSSAGLALLRARACAPALRAAACIAAALVVGDVVVYSSMTDALGSPRAFLERVKVRIGGAYLGDYGGSHWAPQWVCDRTVVPVIETRREAERVLRQVGGPVYFVADRERRERKGLPAGTRDLMEEERPGPEGLVLIGRE